MAFRLTCSAMGPPTGVADGDRARIVHAAPYSRVVVESATPMNVGYPFWAARWRGTLPSSYSFDSMTTSG